MQELQAALGSSADTLASMQFQVDSRTQRGEQLQADLSIAKAEVARMQGQLQEAADLDKCACDLDFDRLQSSLAHIRVGSALRACVTCACPVLR